MRNHTPAGTFRVFEAHLSRLQRMGIGMVWLMPVHPIGGVGRKGLPGSPYAVRDYFAVNVAAEARELPAVAGRWRDLFSAETVALRAGQRLAVPAHGWRVLVAEPAAG